MPRNVRNFWLSGDVDGRRSRTRSGHNFALGPQSRDGGFDLTVRMRDDGTVTEALNVTGRANEDGTLTLTVRPRHGAVVTVNGAPFEGELTLTTKR